MKTKYRIKEVIYENKVTYEPQIYKGFFIGWCGYMANPMDKKNKQYDNFKDAEKFIENLKNNRVKQIKYHY